MRHGKTDDQSNIFRLGCSFKRVTPNYFEQIARNAHALVEEEFTFEKAAERYRQILNRE